MVINRIKGFVNFAEAWMFLALARSILVFLPFKKIVGLLGKPCNQFFEQTGSSAQNNYSYITLAILRAAKYSPWRSKCFEQALTANLMLAIRNKNCVTFFGVKKDENNNSIIAHTWVVMDGKVITGGKYAEQYTIIGSFK